MARFMTVVSADGTQQNIAYTPAQEAAADAADNAWAAAASGRIMNSIKDYRDSYIKGQISYTNSNTVFRLMNDDRTRISLQAKLDVLLLNNDPNMTVNYKTNDGFVDMSAIDIQDILVLMAKKEQLGFDAEKATYIQNSTNPFSSLDNAKQFFDNYITNNGG